MDTKVEQLLARACSLSARFKQGSETRYIDEAIVLDREALDICNPSHPQRSAFLAQLSSHLWIRYNQLGGIEDVNAAILLDREVLALRPPGHPLRSTSLNNLSYDLYTRYNQFGGVDDLNEAVDLNREALVCFINRGIHIANLYARYEHLGGVVDLNEAVDLDQGALALRPPGHPDRSSSLNNLAIRLWTRYNQLGGAEDLNKAIDLDRSALAIRPPGHPLRSKSENNLAIRLWSRYNLLGRVEDLNAAISLSRDALVLCPPGHLGRSRSLNNLTNHLHTRYNQLGRVEDINEAIYLNRDALVRCLPGHSDWSTNLINLVAHISARYKQLREPEDREEAFRLYTELAHRTQIVSSTDLSAAKAWVDAAEDFCHPTTILAYETALRLLVHHLTAFPTLPQHLSVLKALSSSLAVDAFSACLRNQYYASAVELLEQGRGIFWSQLTHLRSPLDDITASGPIGKVLADDFTRLTTLIRNAFDSPGVDQHDRVCRLNSELQRVVSDIRKLPGHSRFLLPLLFSDLRRSASGGPVIIVNASKKKKGKCDVLIVSADKDPVHIPLPLTREDVQCLSLRLHTLTVRAKISDVTKDLGLFLRELWDQVVSPIADVLRTTYPPQSRIWWCPTGEFSLLPLHAAAPYRKGQRGLAGVYISSYTPTLSALIRARENHTSNLATEQKRFLAVGQAKAKGENELLSVGTELANIGHCIGGLATFTRIEGEESCISRVTEELSKNQWVHLACHGLPNRKQPFESAFALHDGHFTIQHIIRCELQNPEFAYLSACHTTVGDEESPDEVIHLASAMQFGGFRSVIGTMWAVDDAETNKITPVFYRHMIGESGHLEHTRAACALWKTMKTMDIPLDQRILYIHLGA